MKGYKITLIDKGYGTFGIIVRCLVCNKTILTQEVSWSKYKIGMGDKEVIKTLVINELSKKEIKFCCKCAAKLNLEEL